MSESSWSERTEGVLLGAAAGDALGWPQELRGGIVGGKKARQGIEPQPRFISWTRSAGSRFSGTYRDPVAAGEYSDDTQLICSLARAYLHGEDWFDWFTRVELPTWRLYQRGGGAATLAAAGSWAAGRPPWAGGNSQRAREMAERYWRAGGNGAAMRAAAHVLAGRDRESTMEAVLVDAAATHGHPRAHIGALLYASALTFALRTSRTIGYGDLIDAARDGLRGQEWAEEILRRWRIAQDSHCEDFLRQWDEVIRETYEQLGHAADAVHRGAMANDAIILAELGAIGPSGGAGTTTAVAAIYLASRSAARPLSGLLAAAFTDNADTDTLASMVGGLLGGIHGTGWLGELAYVQDADFLRRLAHEVSASRGGFQLAVGMDPQRASRDLTQRLPHMAAGDRGMFPDGREFEVHDISRLPPGEVTRSRLVLSDGQTVYVDTRSPAPRTTPEHSSGSAQMAVSSGAPVGVLVVLETSDVGRAARFYSGVLGRDIPIRNGQIELAPTLSIRQSGIERPAPSGTLIELRVRDLVRIASVLEVAVESSGSEAEIRTLDPDGRRLRLRQAQG